jgi:pyruvate formate lyase activating enzyme
VQSGSRSIAYTYTEPTIFFEYALDTARLAHQAGLANIFVTNGYMTREMLELFHPYLDAANVDLKAFRKETYHRYVGAGLQPILDNMKLMKKLGIWLEVTTLVIPGINDDHLNCGMQHNSWHRSWGLRRPGISAASSPLTK